jgi:glycine dehydrogenase
MSVPETSNATLPPPLACAGHPDRFSRRHIGPGATETKSMLEPLGYPSVDALVDAAVPAPIRLSRPLTLPGAAGWSEHEALAKLREIAGQNQVFRSFIGMGYYDCVTPAVIQRNVLENPGWYTQYTPYQAEISQGRLEALLNFQTLITDLTALDIANASMLDEATAAAEAMALCHAFKNERTTFLVSAGCHPQTLDVVRTRARPLGIDVVIAEPDAFEFHERVFGALVQYPDTYGAIHDYAGLADRAHAAGALLVVAADLLALTVLKPPGEFGADIAVGSAQRFGIPPGFGGPHAAFFATRDAFKRLMPGRLVGVSKDSRGRPALRLALQTREQHIRREKATSNICTAQALLANMAALYACYHGPDGLRHIAQRLQALTGLLAAGLAKLGCDVQPKPDQARFDTLRVELGAQRASDVLKVAEAHRMNFRVIDDKTFGISMGETASETDVAEIWQVFNGDNAPGFEPSDLEDPDFNVQRSTFNVQRGFVAPRPSSPNRSSTVTIPKPRCCAISSGWNRAICR